MKRPQLLVPISAVTSTTTSDPINIENAHRVTFEFTRANHSAGSSAFAITVSVDGINYITFNKLIDNVTNTNAQQKTRVAGATLSSNTSKVYSMDLENDSYRFMKITATITTDGDATAKVSTIFNV